MPYRLPPLSTLHVFEAAGRLLSFKLAARELHLTPSAVSHSIQTLEEWLGVELFARTARGLTLTGPGAAYLPQVRQALDILAKATRQLPGRAPRQTLSLSVAPVFASRWLVPRLSRFQEAHPDVAVSMDTRHRWVEFPRDGVDVAIRRGRGPWPGLHVRELFSERLVPVCTPALARTLRSVDDLAGATLLHVVSVEEDWAAWCQAAGVTGMDLEHGLRFDTIEHALGAAVQGAGVALGRRPLVGGELAAGTLVEVLGPPHPSQTAYWLVCDEDSLQRPEVAHFHDWLVEELAH